MPQIPNQVPAIFIDEDCIGPGASLETGVKKQRQENEHSFLEKLKELGFNVPMVKIQLPKARSKYMVDVVGHDIKALLEACKKAASEIEGTSSRKQKTISQGTTTKTAQRLKNELEEGLSGHGIHLKTTTDKADSARVDKLTDYFLKESSFNSLQTVIIETGHTGRFNRYGLVFDETAKEFASNLASINCYKAKTGMASIIIPASLVVA